ncbi:unnamed protein product [Paramecium octaurelia]|uniref:EH domain-containing protein n=1 Tax=Paramecium octaurelia TaxID=43137 RepID=A0A8S1WG27_PAROT|nr:unnamed protein product [Paramecium octaurelia]
MKDGTQAIKVKHVKALFSKSGLSQNKLKEIWNLCNIGKGLFEQKENLLLLCIWFNCVLNVNTLYQPTYLILYYRLLQESPLTQGIDQGQIKMQFLNKDLVPILIYSFSLKEDQDQMTMREFNSFKLFNRY